MIQESNSLRSTSAPPTLESSRGADDDPERERRASGPEPALPYGPVATRLLPLLRHGFLVVNRYLAVPAIRAGLGPLLATPLTGSLLVLRTRGRTTGRWRDAPLGYVIQDGAVYICAGFGRGTQWLHNIAADPRVELILPTVAVAGLAEEVTDSAEWGSAMRALLVSMGLVGRLTVGDVRDLTPGHLQALAGGIPLIRVRPSGLAAGPFDPGGRGWVVPTFVAAALLARWARGRMRRQVG